MQSCRRRMSSRQRRRLAGTNKLTFAEGMRHLAWAWDEILPKLFGCSAQELAPSKSFRAGNPYSCYAIKLKVDHKSNSVKPLPFILNEDCDVLIESRMYSTRWTRNKFEPSKVTQTDANLLTEREAVRSTVIGRRSMYADMSTSS